MTGDTPPSCCRQQWLRGLILICILLPLPANAWGPLGHALIGELAETHLLPDDHALQRLLTRFRQPSQRRRVRRSLLNTKPPSPGKALRILANWPDVHKRDPGMLPHDARRHYVNLPHDAVYIRARHCPDDLCSIETLLHQRAILGNRRAPLAQRAVALAWVTHLVGDIHQPLHAGKAADRGGTLACIAWKGHPSKRVTINGYKKCSGTTLHAVWDSSILQEMTGKSHPDTAPQLAWHFLSALRLVHAAEPSMTARTDTEWRTLIERWHTETQALILRHDIYPRHYALGRDYARQHYPTVRQQLLRAAVRLAALLRHTLRE